jgi:hypothetical protein
MTSADVTQAYNLLARLADLQSRLTAAGTASSLVEVATILTGSGLESTMLTQSRQNVMDFLTVSITQVQDQLTTLGVVG